MEEGSCLLSWTFTSPLALTHWKKSVSWQDRTCGPVEREEGSSKQLLICPCARDTHLAHSCHLPVEQVKGQEADQQQEQQG